MAKAKEVKPCARGDTCDRTLPLNSKHILCKRCRGHDKKVADQNPEWLRNRLTSCARWSCSYAEHLPKRERSNVEVVQFRPRATHTEMRKRA